jgi:hypothetical protein
MLKTQSINLETFGEDVENHINKIGDQNVK